MKLRWYLALLPLLVFSSCKKGTDDPFISLRSREARLKNEWVLQTMMETYASSTNYSGNTFAFTREISVENGEMTIKSIFDFTEVTESYPYTKELSIRRKGAYQMVTNFDGDVTTEDGTWFWRDSSKKKIGVTLDRDYSIKELRNNKLVLTYTEHVRNDYDQGGWDETNINGELIFVGK